MLVMLASFCGALTLAGCGGGGRGYGGYERNPYDPDAGHYNPYDPESGGNSPYVMRSNGW